MAGNKVMASTGSTEKTSENAFHFNLSVEDDLIECIEYVPCPEFEFSAISCYICNGYYGPCFGEPVCATCHAFLFPNDIGLLQVLIFSKKTDDEDSGNDEPTELFYERRASHNQSSPQSVNNAQQRVYLDDENLPVSRQNLPKQVPSIPNVEKLGKRIVMGGNEDEQRAHLYNWNPRLREEPEEHSSFPTLSERLSKLSNYIEQEPINEPGLIERLPPEVLLVVFSNLDDVSLWSAAKVCRRWFGLLSTHVTSQQWQQHVKLRWPLYKPVGSVRSWYRVYDALASSAPCYSCLLQTSLRSRVVRMEENSWRRIRLRNEVKSLRMDPPEGIAAIPLDPMCCHWQATITGPVGSPYEGGLFYLYLEVPFSYPMCPPVVRFLTKILHPNVSRHGDVGIDSIHHNWSLALTLSKVLISVQSLLTDPYCQVCMEPELGEMYTNDRERFDEIARSWTWRYAMHDILAPI